MPTKNPRLSVVLSPALATTLAALSDATGDSASSLARSLLEQAHPALERMLQLVRAANLAKGQIGAGVGHVLDKVVDDLEDAVALANARTDRAMRDLVSEAEAVKGRRRLGDRALRDRAGDAGASTPGPVTRGSGGATEAKPRGRRAGHGRTL